MLRSLSNKTALYDRLQRVESLFKAGKLREAESLLHPLLSVHPHNASVNSMLGRIALEAGVVVHAEAHFRKALLAGPDLPFLHFFLGICLSRQNRFKEALDAFDASLALNPTRNPATHQVALNRDLWERFEHRCATKPIRVALLTTVWQRPAVTRLVLNHYNESKLSSDMEVIRVAVGSEGDISRRLCESAGWRYLEFANRPLSTKWQAGLNALKSEEPDFLITIGSDDILSLDYLRAITDRCPVGGCSGLYDFWFLDLAGKRMGYWSELDRSTPYGGGYIRTLGAGRCYSRSILEDLRWELWPHGHDNRLDGLAEMKMIQDLRRKPTCYSMRHLGALALDIKSGQNLWQFDDYRYSTVLNRDACASVLAQLKLNQILNTEAVDR